MRKDDLLDKLRKKFEVENNNQLSKVLGISPATITRYPDELSYVHVVNLVESAQKQGIKLGQEFSIIPIVEFYPIKHSSSRHNKKWEILPVGKEASDKERWLKHRLGNSKGIYFFYNSEGRVIYIGKTESQSLWKEMKNTFNRKISSYKYDIVEHSDDISASIDCKFKIRSKQAYLYETAYYFSAYDVDLPMIHNLEAFLVRALPNDLRNTRKESFKYPSAKWFPEPRLYKKIRP